MSRDSLSFGSHSGWWRAIGLVMVWCAGLATLVGSGGGGGGDTGGGGTATPSIAISAGSAIFTGTAGSASPTAQQLTVSNGGGGTLAGLSVGAIAYGSGSGWLSASLNTTSSPATLSLQVTTGSLAVGSYSATVPVSAAGVSNSPQSVAVTFIVTAPAAPPRIALSASTASFTGSVGAASPVAQGLTVSNGGGGTLAGLAVGTITYGSSAGWLTANLSTTTAPATLNLQATTGNLAAGTYTATVPVSAAGTSNSPQLVNVTFNVAAAGTLTVISGVASYESIPNNNTSGALVYSGQTVRPIRLAAVDLVASPSGTVLASTTTNITGAYSFTVTSPQAVLVRVRAEMKRTGSTGGDYNFSVRDNTTRDAAGNRTNALYTMDSPAFTPVAGVTTPRDLRAATGWGTNSYTGTRAAAPFSILDVTYEAFQKVLSASSNAVFPALRLFWSVNNRPSGGDLAAGLIGTSFFQRSSAGTHDIYILGAADTDTDEFDRHVVAHEFGHYLQSAFSRDDSLGGQHSGGNRLDMRVAFSEGWGNAWSGIAMGTPFYADSGGTAQSTGFVINVGTAPTTNRGWYSESSVQYLIYQFGQNASIGFTPIFTVLSNMRTSLLADGAVSSIHSFTARLKTTVPSMASTIDSLLAGQTISVNDAIGTGEANNGGVPEALPVYRTHTAALGVAQNYCVSDAAGVSGAENNKLGAHVFIRFTTTSAGTRTITAIGTTSTSDPDFEVISSTGTETVHDQAITTSQTGSPTLSAGTHLIILNDYNLTANAATAAAQSGTRCFNVTIQ
jgi:hypothetical protein